MNNTNKITPEQKYEYILNSGDVGAAIIFLNKEVSFILNLLLFIKTCKNDKEFDNKISYLLKNVNKIRLEKIFKLKKYIKFYQFKAKKYYQKIIDIIMENKQFKYLELLQEIHKNSLPK